MQLDRSTLGAWALASQAGCSIVIFFAGPLIGGILLDKWLGTLPIFLIAGLFAGLALAGYSLIRLSRMRTSKRTPPPDALPDNFEERD